MSFSPLPLAELLDTLCINSGCRICIQDVTGEYGGLIDALPHEKKFHTGPVCDPIKASARGMGMCAACKFRALERARLADRLFTGTCVFGLSEAVRPVYAENHLSAVIFVGNLLHDRAQFISRVREFVPLCGISADVVLDQKDSLCDTHGDLTPWRKTAELVHSYLMLIAAHAPERTCRSFSEAGRVQNELIGNVLAYVRLYYMEPITLSYLARHHYVSEDYLGRLFARETGLRFAEYLNEVRLGAACDRLLNSNDSVTTVAMQTGYNTVSYFNRRFKEKYGMSPNAYRKYWGQR